MRIRLIEVDARAETFDPRRPHGTTKANPA